MKSAARRFFSVLLCAAFIVTGAGCGSGGNDEKQTSLGVDNEIAGFLLNFDQREETSQMVKDKAKGIYPAGVNWSYAENPGPDEKAGEYSSSDPDFAKDVFYALSNTIIVGNAYDHSPETPIYIEMILQGGEKVRYNFVSVNTIRLSEQNYVIESDGKLWTLIRKATEEAEQKETKQDKEADTGSEENEPEQDKEADTGSGENEPGQDKEADTGSDEKDEE